MNGPILPVLTKSFSKWHLFPNPTTSTLRVNIPLDHQEHLNDVIQSKGKLVQTIGHVHPLFGHMIRLH